MSIITLKTSEQIDLITKAATITSDCLSFLSLQVKPGATSKQLDMLANDFIMARGGTAACKGYQDFPAAICISVNSQAVHCIPDDTPFKEGDVVKLDLVVDYKGWKADSALTVLIPPVKPEIQKLVQNTYQAMINGIRQCVEGNTVQDISKAIYATRGDCGVIREFTGHGIGKEIHEAPQIRNYVNDNQSTPVLVAGMVLCIEPIFCIGDPAIYHKKGEWNTWMFSGNSAAHFEHSILINPFPQHPTILTLRKNEVI